MRPASLLMRPASLLWSGWALAQPSPSTTTFVNMACRCSTAPRTADDASRVGCALLPRAELRERAVQVAVVDERAHVADALADEALGQPEVVLVLQAAQVQTAIRVVVGPPRPLD